MSDRILAQNKLTEGEYSCVLVKDGNIIMTSYDKGIKPLLTKLIEDEKFLENAVLADKVIGKAAALLSIFGGIKSVYAHVISDCAKMILEKNGIDVEYNRIVPYIMNKDGTDKCLMEKLIDDIEDPAEAFTVFKNFFKV
ncbi:DUF1893 domain-containing protein [Alkaliphilus sp. MSJ-5]|uniref:DUF1893 domain-containing protein n=1 Tax=Alkaliphilus flagellatus TaxID=2841507 RepID=A0ABS6G3U5_9FIRM|nr:DUF1893 domain-containing protein [Alkaliphilus flagellatus]MBU5677155.1 DUF1893 domain-containing protein [Alkaliphilus flagellatus]